MKTITIQRIYDDSRSSGYRVLVDRLWPRGVSKEDAKLDDWWKELTPSTELRKWFGHDQERFEEFRMAYLQELDGKREEALTRLSEVPGKKLTLLYGAKSPQCNHAIILKEFLESLAT